MSTRNLGRKTQQQRLKETKEKRRSAKFGHIKRNDQKYLHIIHPFLSYISSQYQHDPGVKLI